MSVAALRVVRPEREAAGVALLRMSPGSGLATAASSLISPQGNARRLPIPGHEKGRSKRPFSSPIAVAF